jgi:hypothetical protein
MGLGLVLLVASITLVAAFVLLTEASTAAKAAAVAALVVSFAAPRAVPGLAPLCIALRAATAVAILIYLKARGFVG